MSRRRRRKIWQRALAPAGIAFLPGVALAQSPDRVPSSLRPEIEIRAPGDPDKFIRGDDLGTHLGTRWIGVAGKAHAIQDAEVRPAPLPLNQLFASCLSNSDPGARRSCFRRAGTRIQALRGALSKHLNHPESPLRIPAPSKGLHNAAAKGMQTLILRRLDRLAKALLKLAVRTAPPSPREIETINQQVRWFTAQLSTFATLQRGRFGIAVRGGTSMGAYQAGFLYYLGEFLKAHKARWENSKSQPTASFQDNLLGHFEVATGTSAGALNALLSSAEGCKRPNLDPTQNRYFDAWINVGMTGRHGLFGMRKHPNNRSDHGTFFDPTPIEHAGQRLLADLESGQGYQKECSIDLGLTLTRLGNNKFPLMFRNSGKPLLLARRARERFAFRLQFGGAKQTPLVIRNRRPTGALHRKGLGNLATRDKLAPFYLALGKPSEYRAPVPAAKLIDTAIASGAVPLAFPARRFDFTAFDPEGRVSKAQSGSANFVDGGVFDNRPLDLAMKLSAWQRADEIHRFSQKASGLTKHPSPEALAWFQELSLGLTRASSLRDWQLWNARADLRNKVQARNLNIPTPKEPVPWQEILDLIPVTPRTLIFVEPTLRTSDEPEAPKPKKPKRRKKSEKSRLVPMVLGHALNFVDSARQSSLITSVEQHPWIQRDSRGDLRTRVVVPRRSIPIAGEHLYRFMAFFERDFRVYDYFLGIADARRFVHKDDPVFKLSGVSLDIPDPRLGCLEAYFAKKIDSRDLELNRAILDYLVPACRQSALLNPLEQKGLEELGSKRERYRRRAISRISLPWPQKTRNETEAQSLKLAEADISANNFAAMLVAMHNLRRWRATQSKPSPQASFDAFFGAVSGAGFRFVDLHELGSAMGMGVQRIMSSRRGVTGRGARKIVRQVLEEAVKHLSDAPDRNIDAVGVSLLGKAAADMFRPYDPEWSFDLGILSTGLEARLISHPFYDRFRVDWAVLRLHRFGWHTLLSRSGNQPPNLEHFMMDLELAFRLGARLFSVTKFFRVSATVGPTAAITFNLDGPSTPFSSDVFMRRIGTQIAFELSFLRRIYLDFGLTYWMGEQGHKRWVRPGQAKFDWYTEAHSASSGPCTLKSGHGTFFDCFHPTLSVGWRWDL